MLTKDDISQIGVELGRVIEQNVTPVLDEIRGDVQEMKSRLDVVEHKIDRALYHEIDQHERWIKQLAAKVGVDLARE